MGVANIITNSSVDINDWFDVFNSNEGVDTSNPTLIIGYTLAKSLYGELDFLNRNISENIFWTFSKTERRNYHEADVDKFTDYAFKHLVRNLSYLYVDPIQMSRKSIKKVIQKIYSLDKPISFKHKDMVYIYADQIIFGIDLSLMEFIGLNTYRLINKIKSISSVFLDNTEILIVYKKQLERLNDEVKYIPFLYTISNGK